ncbi:MAG: T9SS type A sorting domain-containing protein [Ignavibacteriales bacterium]|nr:T9SS type A sorting domain-containing protein [Ignavibacteriales bacterium]
MNKFKKLLLFMGLCLLIVGLSAVQAQQSVKIYATDGVGNDSVTIGIHPDATGHIDATLGEYELPPLPPTFDFRCWSMPRWDTLGGTGSKINYHKQVRETQLDTFKFQFVSDPNGEEVTFSWQADMGSVYGGFWRLIDGNGTELCDMTEQTSYTYHTFSEYEQYIMIVKGDGVGYLTATYDSLALAHDSKGKGKAEKRKNYASEGEFHFTNSSNGIDALYVEFSQAVDITQLSPFDKMTNADGKKKKWTFEFTNPTDTLPNPTTVTMFAVGNKGKELVAKTYWWIPAVPPEKWKPTKAGPVNPYGTTSRLHLKMPNWNNVGEETYATMGPPWGTGNGLTLGLTYQLGTTEKGKPIYKYVYHPKWKDVTKTANAKGVLHGSGGERCLDTDMKGKEIIKAYKSLPPTKANQPNEFIGDLLALKFNIGISEAGVNTSAGFGSLKYAGQGGDPESFFDVFVDSFAMWGDRYLSCQGLPEGASAAQLHNAIIAINNEFSGPFDTTSFGVKTFVKPSKYLAEVSLLYRESLSIPEPLVGPGFTYKETSPIEFKLHQNYPNPFNPTTMISFDLSDDAIVTLKVFNLLGQEVATIVDQQEFYEGNNEIEFDASSFASGVYYYRLVVNDGELQQIMKMMLLK